MNSPLHPGTQGLLHILVIGCAGFVGWNVTEFLLADGHNVVGVDNLNDASDVRLKHWRLAQLEANQASPFIPWGLIPRGLPRPCTPKLFNPQSAPRAEPCPERSRRAILDGAEGSVEAFALRIQDVPSYFRTLLLFRCTCASNPAPRLLSHSLTLSLSQRSRVSPLRQQRPPLLKSLLYYVGSK